jgi:chlorite dismutase
MSAAAARPSPEPEGPREFVKYTLLHLRPEWRRRPAEERARGRAALAPILEAPPEGLLLRTYSLVGTKAQAEMLLWTIGPELEPIQELHARIFGSPLGGYLDTAHSYLGMARRSEYLGEHAHGAQEGGSSTRRPRGLPYLVLYPFVKRREWYGLPFEERRRIMGEHFKIGHRFPSVEIHTGYSFGLDDAEFILAFETRSLSEFLDLVQALRPTEASRYTALETPIFTATRVDPARMLELAEGLG